MEFEEPGSISDTWSTDHPGPFLVVGHNAQPEAMSALATAVGLARRLGAFIHVVHAMTMEDFPIDPDSLYWEHQGDQELARQREMAENYLNETDVRWAYHMIGRDPFVALHDAAERCDALMIIVGTRRAWLTHLLRGSVAHQLERNAGRPVLLVPTPQQR
ncbi:universal stress protein [Spiractinospora alimapuensis]|uniref:universal stress protein n=1 Tax=Spiractinospora alimapuensis TaxID=2820884 RepID=UPI001F3F84B6|nr:universal stress protein [Spiractinospora alimapuensis]QVQ50731.1 universal stress protein [Spiractinospora alimapuensis]